MTAADGIDDDDVPSPCPRRICTRDLTQRLYVDRLFMLFSHTKNPPLRRQIWRLRHFHETRPDRSPDGMYKEGAPTGGRRHKTSHPSGPRPGRWWGLPVHRYSPVKPAVFLLSVRPGGYSSLVGATGYQGRSAGTLGHPLEGGPRGPRGLAKPPCSPIKWGVPGVVARPRVESSSVTLGSAVLAVDLVNFVALRGEPLETLGTQQIQNPVAPPGV